MCKGRTTGVSDQLHAYRDLTVCPFQGVGLHRYYVILLLTMQARFMLLVYLNSCHIYVKSIYLMFFHVTQCMCFTAYVSFQVHRACMVTAFVLNSIGFIVIFVEVKGYSNVSSCQ